MKKKKVCVGAVIMLFLILTSFQYTECALNCDVWVDGGCGSTHRIGEKMNIFFEVNRNAYVELYLTYPDGSTSLLTSGDACPGTIYYISGTVGEPAGKRILLLEAWSGSDYDSDTCTYYGGEKPGKIRVESSPSGAKCYLDGDYEGTTPLTISDVPPGSYTIRITKSGYKEWTKKVTVHSGETTYVTATLQVIKGSIHVTSNPSGAKCYLEGSNKGTTPLTIKDLSPGSYRVTLKMNDYFDWEDTVYVSAGEVTNVYASLRLKVGSLEVGSNVDGAFVYLDGNYKGTTPMTIDSVPVGSHTIEISAEKYYDYYETVAVEVNRTTYVDAFLEEKPGSIYVESSPSGAQVYLDGSYQGETPLEISNVKRGTHTLTVTYSGYYDKERYVEVYPNETTTETVYLQIVFWRTWYFAAGVLLFLAMLFAVVYKYKGKKPTPQAPAPTKLKSAFESAARIARAPFVPIEALINIILPEKENRCPICDTSLEKGEILECTHCEDEGFTCKFHRDCWEEHRTQQDKNGKKIRCYKHSRIYVSEGSIKCIPQKEVAS